jgi:hypothetical protein
MFTRELNLLAHKIKKAFGLKWGQALKLAIIIPDENIDLRSSILGSWTQQTLRAIAGHFYGLSKAYESRGDKGRAFYFRRLADRMYACLDAGGQYGFADLLISNKVNSSAVTEAISFYCAAYNGRPTDRQIKLFKYDAHYASVAHLPMWIF